MTDATPLASEQITQEDREAAWKYRPACYWLGDDTMEKWMAGAYDTAAPVISDFARHRIAALSATPAPSDQDASPSEGEIQARTLLVAHAYRVGFNDGRDDDFNPDACVARMGDPTLMRANAGVSLSDQTDAYGGDQDASQAQGERALAIWKRACVGREGYCSSDLQDAAIEAIKQAFREAEAAARSATLPAHYQWSESNREKFDFGRDSAADAIAALSPAPGATAQDGDERAAFERWAASHWPNSRPPASAWDGWQGRAAQVPTPTIPAGMVAWNGGDSAPEDWDSAEPIMLATGHTYRVYETEGDAWWGHSRMDDGALTGGCIIAYTPLAAAPKQAEQQGVERMRAALQEIADMPDNLVPTITVQGMRNVAGFALIGGHHAG